MATKSEQLVSTHLREVKLGSINQFEPLICLCVSFSKQKFYPQRPWVKMTDEQPKSISRTFQYDRILNSKFVQTILGQVS